MVKNLNIVLMFAAIFTVVVGILLIGLQPQDQAKLLNNVSAGAGDSFVAGQAEIANSVNTLCNNTEVMNAAQLGSIQAACNEFKGNIVGGANNVVNAAHEIVATGQNGINIAQDAWEAIVKAAKGGKE